MANTDIVQRVHTGGALPTAFPYPFTLMADTDHSDIEILRNFRDTFRNFANSEPGVKKHVIIEFGPKYEQLFNELKTGESAWDDYNDSFSSTNRDAMPCGLVPDNKVKEAKEIYKDIMQIAMDKKVALHAHDLKPEKTLAKYPDIASEMGRAFANEESMKAFEKKKEEDPVFAQRVADFTTSLIAERAENDAKTLSAVNAEVKTGEKAMLWYGANHMPTLTAGLGDGLQTQTNFIINPLTKTGQHFDAKFSDFPLLEAPAAPQAKAAPLISGAHEVDPTKPIVPLAGPPATPRVDTSHRSPQ